MVRLLRSNILRLIKSKSFYIVLAIQAVTMVFLTINAKLATLSPGAMGSPDMIFKYTACSVETAVLLAAELNVRLAELREKELKFENGDREIKTALTNAAHDLRTPLTAIGGYLDLLETETDKEKRGKYLAVIRERTNTLSKLSEELFVYSVTLDSKPNDAEALDAASVLKECLADFYEAFCAKDITPEICVFPFTVVADKTELSRMFSNIISNALKYSAGDFKVMAVDRKITFSNVAEDVDAIDVSRLFDRFYTVNNGKSSTGLGLSIAKIICERIGGKISAAVDGNRLKITVIF